MKNFLLSLTVAALASTFAACTSDEDTVVKAANTGGLAVGVSAGSGLQKTLDHVTVAVAGAENASLALTSPADVTSATLPAGDYTITAEAFAADGESPVATGTAAVTVVRGQTKAVVIVLKAASGPGLTAVEASAAAPKTHDAVDLTATFEGPAAGTTFAWTHDCRGSFGDASAMNTSFSTPWAETCHLTLTASRDGDTATADVTLDFTWKKGTVVRVAGNRCNIYAGDTAWWEGKFPNAPLVGENGPARDATISHVYALKFGQDGDLYFTEREAGRFTKIEMQTGTIRRLVGIYAGSTTRNTTSWTPRPATMPTTYFPTGFDQAADGSWWIGSPFSWGNPFFRYYPSGNTTVTYPGGTLNRAYGIAVDARGVLYLDTPWENNFARYYPAPSTWDNVAGVSFGGGRNAGAMDIDIGPDGNLYVAERFLNRVTKITPEGVRTIIAGVTDTPGDGLTTAATTTTIKEPFGLDVPANGKVYFTDSFNHKIRVVDNGVMTTLVGPGLNTVEGEAGVAAVSPLEYPTDVARAANGDLYVSQKEVCQIVKIVGPY